MCAIFELPTQYGSMKSYSIPFSATGYYSKLLTDYVGGNEPLSQLIGSKQSWESIDSLLQQDYRLKINRKILVDEIFRQYEGMEVTSAVKSNIAALRSENTFCVVTAHQLSFLGGPLYYVIKIANAINLSKRLAERHPEKHFVPVYWMGSEDHDFEELNHIRLFGKTIRWEDQQGGAFGRYSTEGLNVVLDQLEDLLGADAYTDQLIEIIRTAYSLPSVERASRYLVNALFGSYGLIIVDGDNRVLKGAMKEVFLKEISAQRSETLVEAQSKSLEQLGYHAQATPRPINLFLLSKRERVRIEQNGAGGFVAGEQTFTGEELQQIIELAPENISPNVILRPVFQQSVLPAVAFVGGGGELAYWMQLSQVFKQHHAVFPVLIARTSLLYIPMPQKKKLDKLGLEAHELFMDKDQLKKEYALKNSGVNLDLSAHKERLEVLMAEVRNMASTIDPTLGPAAGAETQKMLNVLDQLQGRMIRAVKQQQEISLRQIDHLYDQLFPEGSLQERKDNFMNFYARSGRSLIDMLVSYLAPIDQQFVIMEEEYS
jgi:bacillithiol synthase